MADIPNTPGVARSLHRLTHELWSYGDPVERGQFIDQGVPHTLPVYAIEAQLWGGLDEQEAILLEPARHVTTLIDSGACVKPPEAASYALTRRVLGALAQPGFGNVEAEDCGGMACVEAELRFERDLSRLERGEENGLSPEDKPVAVILDACNEPCAIQKVSGCDTAYVWRDALLPTEQGECFLPASAIVSLFYGDKPENDPAERYRGTELIEVPGTYVEEALFLRFGVNTFPPVLREAMLHVGVEKQPHLADHLDAARRLNPRTVGQRVNALLEQDRVIRIEE